METIYCISCSAKPSFRHFCTFGNMLRTPKLRTIERNYEHFVQLKSSEDSTVGRKTSVRHSSYGKPFTAKEQHFLTFLNISLHFTQKCKRRISGCTHRTEVIRHANGLPEPTEANGDHRLHQLQRETLIWSLLHFSEHVQISQTTHDRAKLRALCSVEIV